MRVKCGRETESLSHQLAAFAKREGINQTAKKLLISMINLAYASGRMEESESFLRMLRRRSERATEIVS